MNNEKIQKCISYYVYSVHNYWDSELLPYNGYIVQISSEFIEEKLKQNPGIYNQYVNIRNVLLGLQASHQHYAKCVHPNEYLKNPLNRFIYALSYIAFICSIAIFIIVPFILLTTDNAITILATIFAFSAMCFNLYMGEIVAGIQEKETNFWNFTQLLIQFVYSDFSFHINQILNYRADYIAQECISNGNYDNGTS